MQGTRAHRCQLVARLLPTQQPREHVGWVVGCAVGKHGACGAAGRLGGRRWCSTCSLGTPGRPLAAGAAHPRRPGGEFLRCAIEEPQPQSRSQQWHWWAPMRATVGAPLPSAPLVLPKARPPARPFSVFVPKAATLLQPPPPIGLTPRHAVAPHGAPTPLTRPCPPPPLPAPPLPLPQRH